MKALWQDMPKKSVNRAVRTCAEYILYSLFAMRTVMTVFSGRPIDSIKMY